MSSMLLGGTTEAERVRVDMASDQIFDFRNGFYSFAYQNVFGTKVHQLLLCWHHLVVVVTKVASPPLPIIPIIILV